MISVLPQLTRAALALSLITSAASAALVHEWRFNESSGTNLFDSVGTAHGWVVAIPGAPLHFGVCPTNSESVN